MLMRARELRLYQAGTLTLVTLHCIVLSLQSYTYNVFLIVWMIAVSNPNICKYDQNQILNTLSQPHSTT